MKKENEEKENVKKESIENKTQKRIGDLQREIQLHQTRLNQAQQIVNVETQQLLAKQGAVLELQKLLEEKEEDLETEKTKKAK